MRRTGAGSRRPQVRWVDGQDTDRTSKPEPSAWRLALTLGLALVLAVAIIAASMWVLEIVQDLVLALGLAGFALSL